MIIEIDIKTDILEERVLSDDKIPELFSEIARAAKSGCHRIVLNPEVCEWVNKETGLSIWNNREKALIVKIGQDYHELSHLIRQNRPLLRVIYGDDGISKAGECVWQIGHKELIEGKYLDEPVLLVEGEVDYLFFEFLFNAIAEQNGIGALKFTREQAGGENIHANFQEHVAVNKRIVLCICDSDRLVPEGKVGSTFEKVLKRANTLKFIGFVDCTPGHEIENFLPIDTFKSIFVSYDRTKVKNLENLIANQVNAGKGKNLWLYYDTKSNNKMKEKIEGNCEHDHQLKWVEETYGRYYLNDEFNQLPVFRQILGDFMSDSVSGEMERNKFKEYMLSDENWQIDFIDWITFCTWWICGSEELIEV